MGLCYASLCHLADQLEGARSLVTGGQPFAGWDHLAIIVPHKLLKIVVLENCAGVWQIKSQRLIEDSLAMIPAKIAHSIMGLEVAKHVKPDFRFQTTMLWMSVCSIKSVALPPAKGDFLMHASVRLEDGTHLCRVLCKCTLRERHWQASRVDFHLYDPSLDLGSEGAARAAYEPSQRGQKDLFNPAKCGL